MRETALWAAMWWADRLRSGRPGAGIGEAQAEIAMGLVGLLREWSGYKPPSKELIQRFEDLLAAKLDVALGGGNVSLYRDYDTPPMVSEAMAEAGIERAWDSNFPCKTGMRINSRQVLLKNGYGAEYEQVFPERGDRRWSWRS
jgi:hypothetical protein